MEHKDDDDEDVSFAKWMSSFWGHSWREEDERGLRERYRPQESCYRKTSLPCPFPMLPKITSSDNHPRRHSHEDQKFRSHPHMRYYRKYSMDGSQGTRETLESKERSHSQIQEFSESFEQQLYFKDKHSVTLGPGSRKEKNEGECLKTEMKTSQKVEERRRLMEEHPEAYVPPLAEKGPE
ncbi:leukemia NUP98 fusion partner 1 [Perognathus longimembris pacificus]|uniref:leukemia NUP98 fusion partner 1 n=1 Tax=Perognathus longimembris pacificus TaxID=214514 RepID=UPI0020191421|nr:leukemia NUP98 fusion partner 1 [Perognathus longimembris pacificus]